MKVIKIIGVIILMLIMTTIVFIYWYGLVGRGFNPNLVHEGDTLGHLIGTGFFGTIVYGFLIVMCLLWISDIKQKK